MEEKEQFESGPKINVPYVTAEVIVAVTAVFGNALVLYVFCTNGSLRKQSRNYYLFNLALADLLVGLVGIPLAILQSFGALENLSGCLLSVSTLVMLCVTSIVCLVAVSLDRIWATTNPVSYHWHMNSRISISAVAVCWIVGALIGFMPLMGWYNVDGWNATHRCEFSQVVSYSYLAFLYFATCLVPALVLGGIYGYIYHSVIWRIRRNDARKLTMSPSDVTLENMEQIKKMREAKTAAKLGSIVLFFCLCWMPLQTINCVQYFKEVDVPPPLLYFVVILSHANSSLNPLMYAYYLRDFRASMTSAIYRMFRWCFPCCQSGDGCAVEGEGGVAVPWSASSGDVINVSGDKS